MSSTNMFTNHVKKLWGDCEMDMFNMKVVKKQMNDDIARRITTLIG